MRKLSNLFSFSKLTAENFQNFLRRCFLFINNVIDRRSKKWNLDQNTDSWRNSLPVFNLSLNCEYSADGVSSDRVSHLCNLRWKEQLRLQIHPDCLGTFIASRLRGYALRTLYLSHHRFITRRNIFLNPVDFPVYMFER